MSPSINSLPAGRRRSLLAVVALLRWTSAGYLLPFRPWCFFIGVDLPRRFPGYAG